MMEYQPGRECLPVQVICSMLFPSLQLEFRLGQTKNVACGVVSSLPLTSEELFRQVPVAACMTKVVAMTHVYNELRKL